MLRWLWNLFVDDEVGDEAKVLKAIDDGARSGAEISKASGLNSSRTYCALARLERRDRGVLVSQWEESAGESGARLYYPRRRLYQKAAADAAA